MYRTTYITTRSGRLGNAALSAMVSGILFGLLATLGVRNASGPRGPEVTVLSSSTMVSEDTAASKAQKTPTEQQNFRPPLEPAQPEPAAQPETATPSVPATGLVSDRPATSLVSASPSVVEAAGAQGKTGHGGREGAASAATSTASAGTSQAASAPSGSIGDAYGRTVFARIKARQSYVQELARDGIEGSVTLDFLVDPRGRLRDERVATPSGNPQLDRIALNQLRDSAPFPAPPRHKARAFTIRLTYRQTSPR